MGAAGESSSSTVHFQSYPPDLLSRTSSQNQDLRLSLQSFQDPMLLHQHPTQSHSHHHHQQVLFSPLGFDAPSAAWSEHQAAEMGRFQRMVAWNAGAESSGGGGFVFNSPPTPTPAPPPLQPLFGQSQMYSQRGPLQSSNTPSIRAWIDPPIAAAIDHHHQTTPMQPSMISGIGFVPGGFSGFRIPARIQGEEEHDGISDKPSSASSDSRH